MHENSDLQNRELTEQSSREQLTKIEQLRKESIIKDRDYKLLSEEV